MAAVPGRLSLIEPMLATPTRAVPGNEAEWAGEAKWDGARVLAYVGGGTVVLRGRGGGDVTGSYPEVAASLGRSAGRRTLILDGEITVFDGDRPSFAKLQRRMHVARPAAGLVAAVPVTYIAFDLLWQARSLPRSPCAQRRALLDGLALAAEHVSVPPAFPGQARALADASPDLGLEGVVLKRLSSRYQPRQRSGDWLKIRHLAAADVLIGGWLPRAGARTHLAGSVLAGAPGPAGLEYLGSVGSGFAEAELRDLTARLLPLEQPHSPFAGPLPANLARRARWTSPVLAAEVAYAELTPACGHGCLPAAGLAGGGAPARGSEDLEASAVAWLLDVLPPDYRRHPVLRRYPAALASMARHHAHACVEGARRSYRTALPRDVPPAARRRRRARRVQGGGLRAGRHRPCRRTGGAGSGVRCWLRGCSARFQAGPRCPRRCGFQVEGLGAGRTITVAQAVAGCPRASFAGGQWPGGR